MINYKIIFLHGHSSNDLYDTDEDVYIVFETGEEYLVSLVTIQYVQRSIETDKFFSYADSMIIMDFKKETIRKALDSIIQDGTWIDLFYFIGMFKDKYDADFEDIVDMNDSMDDWIKLMKDDEV